MTTERDKCGLSSLLPMSCRGRAEAFARRLHSRLKSLGSQDENGVADEHSWLASHENPISVAQPRHSTDSDLFLDFGLLESPGSPDEDVPLPDFTKIINRDHLSCKQDYQCTNGKNLAIARRASNESDSSDGTYYDLDTDGEQKQVNGEVLTNGIGEEEEKLNNNDVYESPLSSECTALMHSLTLSNQSSLSLPDEDYSSLEVPDLSLSETVRNGVIEDATPVDVSDIDCVDYSKLNGSVNGINHVGEEETYCSHLNVEKDLTVECPLISEVTLVPILESNLVSELSPKSNTNTEAPRILVEDESDEEPLRTKSLTEDDDLELETPTPRVRRCSSLKTGKTPPGTPGRKKIVRFADVLGLDLADVRTFLDEIPKIPNSAYEDLTDADLSESASDSSLNTITDQKYQFNLGPRPEKILMPLFQQPGGLPNFLDRVRETQVCLENAVVTDPVSLSIAGTVRVRNLDFNKSVHVRYTLDGWKSYADLQANYVPNSCDGFSDKFSFMLYANNLPIGQRLEFAIRFQCKGCQYWDGNNGANYTYQCLPATQNSPFAPISRTDNDWAASFY